MRYEGMGTSSVGRLGTWFSSGWGSDVCGREASPGRLMTIFKVLVRWPWKEGG
jgi:hypothetical protein